MHEGATTQDLLNNLERLRGSNVFAVCRIDPIIPGVNDDPAELKELIAAAVDRGAGHIVASVLDIPLRTAGEMIPVLGRLSSLSEQRLRELYSERIGTYYHASIDYRLSIFRAMRKLCDALDVTFALCMEFELTSGRPAGLNRRFMTSTNCEGINVPLYIRRGEYFEPAADCSGACLTCSEALCGVEDLAMARPENDRTGFRLSDYRRWGKRLLAASHVIGEKTSLEH
jgi:hypothetical protein